MILFNKFNVIKSKKVVLPGIRSKDLKPVATLLSPTNLVIPMILISIIGQITDDLKTVLNPKDIQKLSSVRLYFKLLSSGKSTLGLSIINSISKTLGPELETLSILNVRERINFLKLLQKKVISTKSPARITSKPHIISDPNELMKHRKGLALQCRSFLIATPIFAPHSLVLGIPISQVTIDFVVDSSKDYWKLLGLNEEEFDFLLKKEAFSCFKKFSLENFFVQPNNFNQAIRILFYSELKELTNFEGRLIFPDDLAILHGKNNLTLIENELTFLERLIPNLPENVFVQDSKLKDLIIRAAIDQRKAQSLKLNNIFKRTGKKKINGKINGNLLKNINIKKFFYENNY
jgi:hypothetical protein